MSSSTIQVNPVIRNARCRRFTICSFQPSSRHSRRASFRLSYQLSYDGAVCSGTEDPSQLASALQRVDRIRWQPRRDWQSAAPGYPPGCAAYAPSHACVRRTHAAAEFGSFHRLSIHDDRARTSGAARCRPYALIRLPRCSWTQTPESRQDRNNDRPLPQGGTRAGAGPLATGA